MPHVDARAVAVGCIVDVVGSSLGAFAVAGVYRGLLERIDPSSAHEPQRVVELPVVAEMVFVVGALFSIAGGYVAALIAKREPVRHAFLTGVISWGLCLLGIPLSIAGLQAWWYTIGSVVLTIPLAVLGGLLRRRAL